MSFTFTSLPLNFYTSVSGFGCGLGFEQKYWWINGFGGKMARISGFVYPYSAPSLGFLSFLEVKVLGKNAYLNVSLISRDNQRPRQLK